MSILAKVVSIVAIALTVVFVVYEVLEDRRCNTFGKAKCDIIEFMVGHLIGNLVSTLLQYTTRL